MRARLAGLLLVLLAASVVHAEPRVQIRSGGAQRTMVLDHVLGTGGLGTTYEAHDAGDPKQRFAVKVLHSNSSQAQQALQHEHAVLEKLNRHGPGFVKSYGLGEEVDGAHRPAFAMELLAGKSLGGAGAGLGWNAPLHLAAGKSVRIARQLLDQLARMHDAGLVHGDVHTANTRIDDELHSWTARLVDFGTSQAYTPAGGREDVANIGRILLENVSGRLFNDPSALAAADVHHATVGGRVVRLGDVVRAAMAGQYPTAQALADALAPFAAIAP